MATGIYTIICSATGEQYIGTAVDWEHRIASHIRKLKAGKHKNYKMQAAWNKYGPTKFEFKLLEVCTIDDLLKRERWWAEQTGSIIAGFNCVSLGSNGALRHGMTGSRTYKSWDSMLQRCTNSRSPDYHRYGGVGVTVHERWLTFDNFFADMGERPEGTSIDRHPDRKGNYEPGNCRWATPEEQQKNLRNNQYLTIGDETKLLIEWASEIGIPVGLLRRRIKRGLSGDQLFAPSYISFAGVEDANGRLPKRHRAETKDVKKYTAHGKTLTITEWAIELGITRGALSQRLEKYKMPPEKALVSTPLKKGKRGPRKGHKLITAFGKTQSLTRWAAELGLPVSTLKNRLMRAKLPPEEALRA